MKKVINLTVILTVLIFGFSACQKVQTVTPNSANRIQQGNWKVTLYNDSNKDETTHFIGYVITFSNNGMVSASKNGTAINGTWSIGNDDSTQKLLLNFGEVAPFDELTDDWHIIEQTDNIIRLEDVSGGNGGTDLLTIEKI